MNKTLKLSFSLKNTYRVNSILFSLKQIPLLKRLLPEMLYKVTELKIFANVLSVLWEIFSVFLGKLLYLLTMVWGAALLYESLPDGQVFLHILLFLTIIGSFMNTKLFNPTKDKYYAMFLMPENTRWPIIFITCLKSSLAFFLLQSCSGKAQERLCGSACSFRSALPA